MWSSRWVCGSRAQCIIRLLLASEGVGCGRALRRHTHTVCLLEVVCVAPSFTRGSYTLCTSYLSCCVLSYRILTTLSCPVTGQAV